MDADSILHSFSFATADELLVLSSVSKAFESYAKNEGLWEILCTKLWENKQNHPRERWVSMPSDDFDEVIQSSTLDALLQKHLELRASVEALYLDIDEGREVNDAAMSAVQHLEERLFRLSRRIRRLRAMDASQNQSYRRYAPLSRALRQRSIRWEALLMRTRAALLEEELLEQPSPNAPTKEELKELERRTEMTLEGQFDSEMQQTWQMLSWRESYFASIEDSKRREPLHWELRELGDFLILFGEQMEMCRFVDAGWGFIDDRAFRAHVGTLRLIGNRMILTDIEEGATATRDPDDWGWVFSCDNAFVSMASFDRMAGPEAHRGALSRDAEGKVRDIEPLWTHLKDDRRHQAIPWLPHKQMH